MTPLPPPQPLHPTTTTTTTTITNTPNHHTTTTIYNIHHTNTITIIYHHYHHSLPQTPTPLSPGRSTFYNVTLPITESNSGDPSHRSRPESRRAWSQVSQLLTFSGSWFSFRCHVQKLPRYLPEVVHVSDTCRTPV